VPNTSQDRGSRAEGFACVAVGHTAAGAERFRANFDWQGY